MNPITTDHLLGQLRWRYATKQFDATKKIPQDTWSSLEEALILTPSSFGLQPWKFLVIQDPTVRAALKGASWGQSQITDASHLVVFAVHRENTVEHVDSYIQTLAAARSQAAETFAGLRKVILQFNASISNKEWNARQAYIALGNFMTAAALLSIDTCPIEGLDPVKYDEILGLEAQNLATAVVCAAGYRATEDKYAGLAKARFPKSEVIQYI